jgi:hypothetical protein
MHEDTLTSGRRADYKNGANAPDQGMIQTFRGTSHSSVAIEDIEDSAP